MESKKELIDKILQLKKEKNAIILAHYYESSEIQDIADYVGDSLELARIGQASTSKILIICGVRFMAESGKILSNDKKVLIPEVEAGCPMADMVDYDVLKKYKKEHPNKYIVSYVNTSAAVKSLTDICVTSSNALTIVKQLLDKELLFLPDKNLGTYINEQIEGEPMELWQGYCPVHNNLDISEVKKTIEDYPQALVLAHPECQKEILDLADYIGSTKGIIKYVENSDEKVFIIATEEGILYPLRKNNPTKQFYLAAKKFCCKDMKKIGLQELYTCLEEETGEINLEINILEKAILPLTRMLALSE